MPTNFQLFGHTEDPETPKSSGYSAKFECMVNPSRFKHKKGMLFNSDNRANGSQDVKQWKGYSEETLEVTLFLEGTGYATSHLYGSGGDKTAVENQLKDLNKLAYDYDGGIHKPMYVSLFWQSFKFLGHIKSMDVNHEVFNSEGECIAATVDFVFTIHIDNKTAAMKQNRNSPDMSHLQVMKDGDQIPLICNKIYDDPTYYIQIAQLNGLTNFREVANGKKLLFPPLINE